MPRLVLSVLGPFQASLDGRAIEAFSSNKARALLIYLALESDRPHPRSALTGLLWPGYAESSALTSLRSALANLRTAIGDREAEPPFLLITRDSLQVNLESDYALDADILTAATPGADTDASALETLRRAATLYRGEFLLGFSLDDSPAFEEWAVLRREQFHQHALAILHALAAHHVEAGEPAQAEVYARRCLELDGWDEEAHRQLMQALATDGKRSAALQHYEACARLLAEGLGVEPDPRTVALYERIRDGDVRVAVGREGAVARRAPPVFESLPRPTAAEAPLFVAREEELGQLERCLDAALVGHGQVAFVVGEPGSGKTALVQEFARRSMVQHGDLVAATGKCDAMVGAGDPYLPFIDILETLAGDIRAEWLSGSISPEQARRLWSVMPETVAALCTYGQDLIDRLVSGEALVDRVRTHLSNAGLLTDLQEARARGATRAGQVQQAYLFEQYTHVLQTLAQKRPLLLILDDLQWADAGSLGLLFHLGRRLEGYPILIVGTYRPEEVALGRDGARHPLEPVVAELQRVFGPTSIDLGQADGWAFQESLLASQPNRLGLAFREMLHHCAGGQPLFTLELLRGLQEQGDLYQDEVGRWCAQPDLDWDRLPARVEAVIAERVGRLSSELRETLAVASVEGETFAGQVIARVRDLDERAIIGQLSGPLSKDHRLVAAQGVTATGGRPIYRYRFHHHLVQAYVYEQLDAVERAYLHGRVGDALKELHGEQPQGVGSLDSQLGRHYREAGRLAEASQHLHAAALEAIRLSATEEALRYLGQALELIDDPSARAGMLAERGKLFLDLYRGQEAAEDLEVVLEHARRTGDRAAEFEALLGLGQAHYVIALDAHDPGYALRCRQLYEAAYDLARELGDKARMARALILTGWLHTFWIAYRPQARANVREAVALSQEVGDEDLVIASKMGLFELVSPLEAEPIWEDLARRLTDSRDLARLNGLCFRLMWTHLRRGNYARSIEWCDKGVAVAETLGVPPVQYATLRAMGWVGLGRYDAAWASLQAEVVDEAHPFARMFQSYGEAVYYLGLMAHERARATLEEAIVTATRLGRDWLRRLTQIDLVRAMVRSGQVNEPRVARIREELASKGDPLPADALAELALWRGSLDEALQEATRGAQEAGAEGRRPIQATALELQARALSGLGRPQEALKVAQQGVALAEAMGAQPMLWRFRAARAQALEALGDPDAAQREYEAALAILRELSATIPQAELKQDFWADSLVVAIAAALGRDPTKED